jgi:hypothetical protein
MSDDMMPFEADEAVMWTLSDGREIVRLALPPLPIEGMAEPLQVTMDFDAEAVDAIIARLSVLRAQMLPTAGETGEKTLGRRRGHALG